MDQDQQQDTGAGTRIQRGLQSAGARVRAAHANMMARPLWQRLALMALCGGAALLTLLFLWILLLIPLTPGISDLRQARAAQPTVIVAADGKELTSFEEGFHEHVPLAKISPHVIKALIATEDHRFYEHHGIDFKRTAAALAYSAGGDPQGGSTLTQQLARNLFPKEIGRSRNISRKLKEIVTAIKIESAMTKDEILEAYLNTVPFLYNAFGIEMAARTYFGKPAAKLDILESATLVGMLKGTNYYNPVSNPERSKERRNVVLGQLMRHGVITKARFEALKKRPLKVRFERQSERSRKSNDSHFTAYVRKWLLDWADENDYNLERDGLVVHTTLDPDLQEAAQKAVARQAETLQAIADVEWSQSSVWSSSSTGDYTGMRDSVKPFDYFWKTRGDLLDAFIRESASYRKALDAGEDPKDAVKRLRSDRAFLAQLRAAKTRLEAGFVALDPRTGEVKAWVGSRDFRRDQFDHVVQAERQPGSTFKPIVYGAALEKGLTPDHSYRDAVLDIRAGDGTVWRPTDMDGTTGEMVPMRDGLVYSKNTVTAQVMQDVGLSGIVSLAQGLGIRESKLDRVPSLALGTSPVTLLEMVNVYASIAAQGQYRKPVFVRRITDRAGNVIAQFENGTPEQVMSQQSAVTLIDMMRGVVNRGTGTAVRYRFGIYGDVAGKTGTTQRNADGWFILMHPELVGGAWVGFNDNRVTMRSNYWGQGGHNAIRLVGDFFKTALDERKIDPKATFPGGRPPAAARPQEEVEEEEVLEDPGELQTEDGKPAPDPYQPEPQPLPDPDDVPVEEIDPNLEQQPPAEPPVQQPPVQYPQQNSGF